MKNILLPAIKLTALSLILLVGAYTSILFGIAQIMPDKGEGKRISQNGHTYYSNIAQSFTRDDYFWSRPSAVNHNPAGSGGSNKSPYDSAYLQTINARIDTFLAHNPAATATQIPIDLITASGSGLDPHISPQAALVQVKRIATIRNLPEYELNKLIESMTEQPFLALFGPKKINVLQLNLSLDKLTRY